MQDEQQTKRLALILYRITCFTKQLLEKEYGFGPSEAQKSENRLSRPRSK